MANALITGINGFTGGYLAAALRSAGYSVAGTGLGAASLKSVEYYRCDLCDRQVLREIVESVRPEVVIHLAAIAFAAHDNIEALYRTNLLGTRTLLDVVANSQTQPRSVILASSANVYGNATSEVLDEKLLPTPANDYAVSKLAMEYVAKLWAEKLPITIVRPFNYTGIGQSEQFVLPKIVDHFRRRVSAIELGNLDVVRDFSDVRVVAKCYVRLLETQVTPDIKGQTFNICSGIGHSLSDVLEIMRGISGHDPEIRVNPIFVRSNELKRLVGSRAKLESAIGPIINIEFRRRCVGCMNRRPSMPSRFLRSRWPAKIGSWERWIGSGRRL